jgi:uncharacterized membrane protein YqhA
MSQPEVKPKQPLTVRLMSDSRYIIWLAVVCTFVGSMTLMLIGTYEMFSAIWYVLANLPAKHSGELKLVLIESVDTFLVATVILMISLGLYQLFVNRELQLPAWLNTHGIEDLENRLAGMIIIVMAVIFLTQLIQWNGEINLLWSGLAIAGVILAISAFLYQESRHGRTED